MNSSLLSFHQVRFGYNRKASSVLDGLDLSLKEGCIAAILGPNGAGKTTLLYLALGWLKPWAGVIRLSGKPIESFSRRTLGQQIALIPQSEHIPFEYTVLEYVLLGRAPYLPTLGMPSQADERIAYDALEKVGIANLFDHSVLGISGGERQLVLAARALAQEPRLLLLDEPTSHLDLSNKYRLAQILRSLQERGTTILMTTHEPDLAMAVSDEAILMQRGKVHISGPTAEVATGENLSRIYSVPVKIMSVEGKKQVSWM
ncbi:MAG TPA: ABC transporter ATP-binding protein [Anaerolineaceae bacterium]|nr:ABC transporter ATP-binding protein [Anaerolineaceae bacterium]HPN53979.1 ABC transporter ATP-binding protein [Anaerolineaceae bacterium]